MSDLVVNTEKVGAAQSRRRKPTLAIRGLRRRLIRKLKVIANEVFRADTREQLRSERLLYEPYLFTISPSNKANKALLDTIKRCEEALDARVG